LSVNRTSFFAVPLIAAAFAACGGASDTDFDNGPNGSAGEPDGGTGGSVRGGSGGTSGSSSGSGGSTQGGQAGTEATGGTTTGGSASGGDAGTETGGASTGGAATGGSSTGGSSTGGSSTGGSSTGGSSTGGSSTGGSGGTLGGAGSGVGGTGLGGVAGRGGGAGKGGAGGRGDCTAIVTSAQAALNAAQVCSAVSATPKCAGTVQDLCGCTVPVNDPNSEATKSYLAQREAAIACGVPCLAIACREPTTVTCGFAGATTNIVVAPTRCMYSPR
jgi:hypothetical protein